MTGRKKVQHICPTCRICSFHHVRNTQQAEKQHTALSSFQATSHQACRSDTNTSCNSSSSASPSPGTTLLLPCALLRPSPQLQGWEPADTVELAATLCCSARAQDAPRAQAGSFPHTPGEGDGNRGGSQPPRPAPCPGRFSCPQVTRGAITVQRKGTAVKQP